MKSLKRNLDQPATRELARVVEPLAGYISAADRPREALQSALAVLLDELDETHRAAIVYAARLRGYSL
jgi:hypothetical protein